MIKLSKNSMKILKLIFERPGLSQFEISAEIKLSKGSVSIFIKNARKNNLIFEVKREQKIKIHPTKLGKDIIIEEIKKRLTRSL